MIYGTILSVKNNRATVELEQGSSECNECEGCKGCADKNKKLCVIVTNNANAKIGDRVQIKELTRFPLMLAFMVLLAPVLIVFFVYFVFMNTQIYLAAIAVIFLISVYSLLLRIMLKKNKNNDYNYEMLEKDTK